MAHPTTPQSRELVFLMAKFLSDSRFTRTYQTLREEIDEQQARYPHTPPNEEDMVLPARYDWLGVPHMQTYEKLGADDSLVKVWCAETGHLMRTLRGHTTFKTTGLGECHVILDIAINQTNTMLASASSDRTVMVWDTQTWLPIANLELSKAITTISFSPTVVDEVACIAVGCKDGKTRLFKWLPEAGTYDSEPLELVSQDKRTDSVRTCGFNRTGSRFAVGGTDGLVYVYHLIPKSWERAARGPRPDNDGDGFFCRLMHKLDASSMDYQNKGRNRQDIGVKELRFSHKGEQLLTACMDGTATVFKYNGSTERWDTVKLIIPKAEQPQVQRQPSVITVPLPGDEVAPVDVDGAVNAGPPAAPEVPLDPAIEAAEGVTAICWALDDDTVITALDDNKVRVWRPDTGELMFTMEAHTGPVYNLDAHPKDRSVVLSASYDGLVVLWDITTGIELTRFDFGRPITDASFRADGEAIGVVDMGGYIHFITAPVPEGQYPELYEQFFSTDFDPVSRGPDGQLWDTSNDGPPHLIPQRACVDSRHTQLNPRYNQLRIDAKLDRALPLNTVELMEEYHDKLALVQTEATRMPLEHATMWTEKDSRERRRARPVVVSDSDVDRNEEFEMQNAFIIAPQVSSGDDFEQDENEAVEEDDDDPDADDDWEALNDDGRTDADFIDDAGVSTRRKTRRRKLKRSSAPRRTRRRRSNPSEDEDEDAEYEPSSPDVGSSSRRRNLKKKSYAEVFPDEEDDEDDFLPSDNGADDEENIDPVIDGEGGQHGRARKGKRRAKSKREKLPSIPPSPISEIIVPSPWVTVTATKRSPYLPQIGDMVAYIKSGHRAFVTAAAQSDVEERNLRNGTPLADPRRPEVIFGKIEKLEFTPGDPVACHLSIQVYDDELQSGTTAPVRANLAPVVKGGRKDLIKLLYYDLDGSSEFIILFDLYAAAVQEGYKVGDAVEVEFPGDAIFAGTIENVLHTNSTPWNRYLVRWDSPSDDPTSLSAWELNRPDTALPYIPTERLSGDEMTRIADILRAWRNRPEMALFTHEVDYPQYPTYLGLIGYPVCLQLILERVKNGFYRRVEAVKWDIETMMRNAMLFNHEGSELYEIAAYRLPELAKEVMGGGSRVGTSHEQRDASPTNGDDDLDSWFSDDAKIDIVDAGTNDTPHRPTPPSSGSSGGEGGIGGNVPNRQRSKKKRATVDEDEEDEYHDDTDKSPPRKSKSKPRKTKRDKRRRVVSDDDDDENWSDNFLDDDDDEGPGPSSPRKRSRRNDDDFSEYDDGPGPSSPRKRLRR
ncbi:Bromodomain and WD repeat-containing protein 3 [Geranomyces michiganensis]|nr:Bromodomain and WD repeat-containing protein 3 [Geranomyces michiganensis]